MKRFYSTGFASGFIFQVKTQQQVEHMSKRNQIQPIFFIYVSQGWHKHFLEIHFLILFLIMEGEDYFPW